MRGRSSPHTSLSSARTFPSASTTFDAARTGVPWRYLPGDFPPHDAVFQPSQRWARSGAFEAMAHHLRTLLHVLAERDVQPTGAVLGSRTIPLTPSSGHRAAHRGGYDGSKRRKGSKIHAAVDTLCRAVQEATEVWVEVVWVDQEYTGERAAEAASAHRNALSVVKHTEAKRGLVLLPRRWVVERSFAWPAQFRRLARHSRPPRRGAARRDAGVDSRAGVRGFDAVSGSAQRRSGSVTCSGRAML